jgi:cyclopropane fatty-acyl-phospholipid synthase-like methyltransferase
MLQSIRSILSVPTVYRLWGEVVGGSSSVQTLVREYIRPTSDAKILEIGCGPGNMVPYLPQSGYLGFDLSPEYIDQARKRFPKARFACERVSQFKLAAEQSFDLVLAIGVIHHLDDSEAIQLFEVAHQALKAGGRLVTVDGVFTDDQSGTARWLLSKDRGSYVRTKDAYLSLAKDVFEDVTPVVRHDLLRIPYTHLILQCIRRESSARKSA